MAAMEVEKPATTAAEEASTTTDTTTPGTTPENFFKAKSMSSYYDKWASVVADLSDEEGKDKFGGGYGDYGGGGGDWDDEDDVPEDDDDEDDKVAAGDNDTKMDEAMNSLPWMDSKEETVDGKGEKKEAAEAAAVAAADAAATAMPPAMFALEHSSGRVEYGAMGLFALGLFSVAVIGVRKLRRSRKSALSAAKAPLVHT
eukprot:gnl/TRDRNA2_/TRDRNA2_92823_c0_seq1.p1 gnl/TRDRNA2_/TRDRNA2_92823_c0~~gnl/TRDRNA2_/TRDRNA2_92823_c0_seq1.p1  ORF type:complete len:220 (+),score=64.77 gnl/TRDRNA2_/TRDRNA2_92823_c0_seq1:61-660(+)